MLNIIFDIDGTLIDSGDRITAPLVRGYKEVTGRELDYEEALFRMDGFDNDWYRTPDMTDADMAEIKRLHGLYMRPVDKFPDPVFEGVYEMLDRLIDAGCSLHVCSARPHGLLMPNLDRYDFTHRFTHILSRPGSSFDDTSMKEKREVLKARMAEFGLDPACCVMVGDLPGDIRAGQYCGITTIGVTYGFAPRHRLEPFAPTYMVDTVAQLEALLLSLNSRLAAK